MSERFDIVVPIRENLKKGLIFQLKSRVAIVVILTFYGYKHEVLNLL